ncbi:hypothetical protein RvY_16999 [Ramazzottius varieornatus]|uniref:Uncharacterized protein n=1 Tax=Ramazzottius varieornatus TaxID=947166 RepID=A0A1D1W6R0_RAMVA|nr:hypothetical protein RvY_16999 [Ramazzottius varieornatus]
MIFAHMHLITIKRNISTQFLLTLHFPQGLLAELPKLSARFQREDYRLFDLHDTLEEFVKVLNSGKHNESVTTLKDRIKFQHDLVFFHERPDTIGTVVNDYNGNSFTAFRKESVDLLQNVLIFVNLRISETEATRHFRVFHLNKIPRQNGRYGDTHIQVLARYFGFKPLTVRARMSLQ